jgi:hypothetical protein
MGQQTVSPLTPQSTPTAPSAAATTLFQSITDSFSVQVPDGWIIQDIDNTGSTLLEERTQGYGMLAQLCPEEQQQRGGAASLSNASGGSTNSISSLNASRCLGAQDVIHIIRYPDLETRIQTANNITTYYLQKLQEVGYRGIQAVGGADMTVNITNPQTNQTTAIVPAKFVEMTYSTNFVPNEIRTGYFILTATNSTAPNPGTTKGYSVFYEGSSAVAAEVITTTTTTSAPSSLPPTPLSTAVGQVFGSFELIAAPEVVAEQAIVQTEQTEQAGGFGQVEQTECDPSYPGVCIPPPPPDFNCGDDGVPENFAVSGSDPHGFDADNDGIGCEDGNGDGDDGGDDGDDNGGDTSCHPSYPDECIPPPPPNLNCDDVDATNFAVSGSDPHGFDADNDGIGCEDGNGDGDDGGGDDNGGGDDGEPEPEDGGGGDEGGEGGGGGDEPT